MVGNSNKSAKQYNPIKTSQKMVGISGKWWEMVGNGGKFKFF
jgi:hypothetical protein